MYHKNIARLFNIQITVVAGSSFPNIAWLDFARFGEACRFVDLRVQQQDVDRFFMASAGKNLASCRFQFFEALMRIAEAKYYHSGQTTTHARALQMLLESNVFPVGLDAEWQGWREKVWWTYANHRIIHANELGLMKIYKSYFAPRKKHMNKNDCIDLMTRDTKIIPDENKVSSCYGMSK